MTTTTNTTEMIETMTEKMTTFATYEDLRTHMHGAWGDLTDEEHERVCRQLLHEARCDGVLLSAAAIDEPGTETHDWAAWLDSVDVGRVVEFAAGRCDTITHT